MRTIKLKSLALVNFKGIRDLFIEFADKETFICGENAIGKTSVFDSYFWLLFGKDSSGRSDSNFNIKTLGADGKPILHLEHSVTGVLLVDGREVKLQRKYVEKWVKPSGTTEETLQNHQTQFYVNDVKMGTKKEYDAAIAEILPEDVSKMITNPFYFTSLAADVQRDMLLEMSGNITDQEIANMDKSFAKFLEILNGRPMEKYMKEISAKKKALNDELAVIPSQIETANRLKPEAENWKELEDELAKTRKRVAEIDDQLADTTKIGDQSYNEKKALQDQLNDAKMQLNQREVELSFSANKVYSESLLKANNEKIRQENAIRSNVQVKVDAINQRKSEIKIEAGKQRNDAMMELTKIKGELELQESTRPTLVTLKNQIQESINGNTKRQEEYQRLINAYNTQLDALRSEYRTLFAKTWEANPNDFICPTCKRPLEVEDIEAKTAELTANFNNQKAEELKANKEKGLKAAADLKHTQELLQELNTELAKLNSMLIEADEKIKDGDNNIAIKKQEIVSKQASVPAEPDYEALFASDAQIQVLTSEMEAAKAVQVEVDFPVEPNIDLIKSQDQSCIDLKNQITELQNQIDTFKVAEKADIDTTQLNQEKDAANEQIEDLIKRLAKRQSIANAEKELADLEEKKISSNQALADLEKIENMAFNFQRAKDKAMYSRINGMFKVVSFKFENAQLNGGTKLTCICTVNGVPYPDVNAAGKIQAGLDIINAICTHKGISAPIFIDNRESVNYIEDSVSQIINLCVTKDKKLTIKQ